MSDKNKTSVLKDAILEFAEIQKNADDNAKRKLSEEFSARFNQILSEELKKGNNIIKESEESDDITESDIKDENDNDTKEESKMKNQKEETTPVVNEGDTNQPFDENPKKVDNVNEERDKDFMGDVESDTPNLADKKTEDGDTYTDNITTKKETLANDTTIKENLDIDSVGDALDNAGNDEAITLDDIEAEINEIVNGTGDKPSPESNDPYDEIVKLGETITEMIANLGISEQKNNGGQGANNVNDGGPTQSMIEETDEISDEEINDVVDKPEDELDEAHGVSYSSGTITTGKLGDNYGSHGRFRGNTNENVNARINSLIEENKKLTKKINENKKSLKTVNEEVDKYKGVLNKYRSQLKEMAVFNSNLAHVNNLLVNEELALSFDEKMRIIKEFKEVDSIASSEKKYNNLLSEMKEAKKSLNENIEDKVSTSIQPSSKNKINEVVESTAYTSNSNDILAKIKSNMNYMEKRGK